MAKVNSQSHLHAMDTPEKLIELRRSIDVLDEELVHLLAKRQALVHEVLGHKKAAGLPGRIQSRVDQVIQNAVTRGAEAGLDPDLARVIWTAMVEWFVKHEEQELEK
jgi:isochorismate pyruvate lyase